MNTAKWMCFASWYNLNERCHRDHPIAAALLNLRDGGEAITIIGGAAPYFS
jgi:hypothetical protein